MLKPKQILKYSFRIVVAVFACTGVFFVGGYLATKYHLTDVSGAVDGNSGYYAALSSFSADATANADAAGTNGSKGNLKIDSLSLRQMDTEIGKLQLQQSARVQALCKLQSMSAVAGDNHDKILAVYLKTASGTLFNKMVAAVNLHLQQNTAYTSAVALCSAAAVNDPLNDSQNSGWLSQAQNKDNVFAWTATDSWSTIQQAMAKDKDPIIKASVQAGIEPRLLVSDIFVEQMRLYTTEREYYKQLFSPLKIFATTNKFAWGVTSIKEATAKEIEANLKDASSPYYLGADYEHLLDFKTATPDTERYTRLTDLRDHYYSYLYAALYIRQLESQWQKAGFPINYRPEIIGTLYNISFKHSHPNANPGVGGSTLTINNVSYSFGALAYEYYYSGELTGLFPYATGK